MYVIQQTVLLLHTYHFSKSLRCHLGTKYVGLLEFRQRKDILTTGLIQ